MSHSDRPAWPELEETAISETFVQLWENDGTIHIARLSTVRAFQFELVKPSDPAPERLGIVVSERDLLNLRNALNTLLDPKGWRR